METIDPIEFKFTAFITDILSFLHINFLSNLISLTLAVYHYKMTKLSHGCIL